MISPTSGCFLLATPLLDGSWFQDKVIFLADHSDLNSYGFAINHSAQIPLDEVFSGFHSKERKPFRFFFGGPVQEDQVQVLEFAHPHLANTKEIVPGIWLRTLAEEEPVPILDLFSESTTRIVLGYSGWSAGQLDFEIKRGCWEIISPDPSVIFSRPRDELFATPSDFKTQFAPN